jgi:hypothetical protein
MEKSPKRLDLRVAAQSELLGRKGPLRRGPSQRRLLDLHRPAVSELFARQWSTPRLAFEAWHLGRVAEFTAAVNASLDSLRPVAGVRGHCRDDRFDHPLFSRPTPCLARIATASISSSIAPTITSPVVPGFDARTMEPVGRSATGLPAPIRDGVWRARRRPLWPTSPFAATSPASSWKSEWIRPTGPRIVSPSGRDCVDRREVERPIRAPGHSGRGYVCTMTRDRWATTDPR